MTNVRHWFDNVKTKLQTGIFQIDLDYLHLHTIIDLDYLHLYPIIDLDFIKIIKKCI